LNQLELRDELLLLQLKVLKSWRVFGSVALKEVGLLNKVHLKLFLQLWYQLLKSLATPITRNQICCILLLHKLLDLSWIDCSKRALL